MLVKFFKPTDSTGATGGLDYLLSLDKHEVEPELLYGDIDVTRQLLLNSSFKNAYTTGCLSFTKEETELADSIRDELIQSFEETLLAGLEPNQYDICWIKHTDKDGRLELNFHVLNTELQTGKRLQPYLHQFDKPRIEAWKSLQNDTHGLSDPNAPERRRTLQPGALKQDWQSVKDNIHNHLESLWINNEINSRADILNEIKKQGGEIKRQGKDYISFKFPEIKNIRLKGELYSENLRSIKESTDRSTAKQNKYNQEREQRIEVNREKLDRLNSKISEVRREKYKYSFKATPETKQMVEKFNLAITDSLTVPEQRNIDVSENIRTVRENIARMQRISSGPEADHETFLQDKTIEQKQENGDRNGSEHRTFNTKLRAIAIAVRAAVQRFRSAFDIDRAQREREQAERIERINEQVRKTNRKKLRERTNDRGSNDRTAEKQPVQNVQLREARRELERDGLEL